MPRPASAPTGPENSRRTWWVLVALIGAVVLCYILGTPRNGGPDEPSHMVASSGLMRGDRDGRVSADDPLVHNFDLPMMVGRPDPTCWALDPYKPVTCVSTDPLTTDTAVARSTSYSYPPWAYVLPGLASYVPWPGSYAYVARALSAVLVVLLAAAALNRLRTISPTMTVAALLSMTPIVWFTVGVVNPSALAIGGGLALWTALLTFRDTPHQPNVLLAVGWAATLLPRRDGPVWATLIVLVCCLVTEQRPLQIWRRPPRWTKTAIAVVSIIPLLNSYIDHDTPFNVLLTLAPLGLVGVELGMVGWARLRSRRERALATGAFAIAVAVVAVALVRSRPGGFDAEQLRRVLGQSGEHLRQIVGILGWLDAPVPWLGVFLFWAALGGLGLIAMLFAPRVAAIGFGCIVAAIALAWLMELGQAWSYGNYWQGRYTLPFAVGWGLVFASGWRSRLDQTSTRRLARAIGVMAWAVWNFGFIATQQRWAVGKDGSYLPWDWNTWGSPVNPMLLCAIHGVATAALIRVALDRGVCQSAPIDE